MDQYYIKHYEYIPISNKYHLLIGIKHESGCTSESISDISGYDAPDIKTAVILAYQRCFNVDVTEHFEFE